MLTFTKKLAESVPLWCCDDFTPYTVQLRSSHCSGDVMPIKKLLIHPFQKSHFWSSPMFVSEHVPVDVLVGFMLLSGCQRPEITIYTWFLCLCFSYSSSFPELSNCGICQFLTYCILLWSKIREIKEGSLVQPTWFSRQSGWEFTWSQLGLLAL